MIVVDTSAIIAIILGEAEAREFTEIVARAPRCLVPAPIVLETFFVLNGEKKLTTETEHRVEDWLETTGAEIVPFSEVHERLARRAFLLYGKGRNSKSKLNILDCMSYAVAAALDAPLLYKGGDFSETDIRKAA